MRVHGWVLGSGGFFNTWQLAFKLGFRGVYGRLDYK